MALLETNEHIVIYDQIQFSNNGILLTTKGFKDFEDTLVKEKFPRSIENRYQFLTAVPDIDLLFIYGTLKLCCLTAQGEAEADKVWSIAYKISRDPPHKNLKGLISFRVPFRRIRL